MLILVNLVVFNVNNFLFILAWGCIVERLGFKSNLNHFYMLEELGWAKLSLGSAQEKIQILESQGWAQQILGWAQGASSRGYILDKLRWAQQELGWAQGHPRNNLKLGWAQQKRGWAKLPTFIWVYKNTFKTKIEGGAAAGLRISNPKRGKKTLDHLWEKIFMEFELFFIPFLFSLVLSFTMSS